MISQLNMLISWLETGLFTEAGVENSRLTREEAEFWKQLLYLFTGHLFVVLGCSSQWHCCLSNLFLELTDFAFKSCPILITHEEVAKHPTSVACSHFPVYFAFPHFYCFFSFSESAFSIMISQLGFSSLLGPSNQLPFLLHSFPPQESDSLSRSQVLVGLVFEKKPPSAGFK